MPACVSRRTAQRAVSSSRRGRRSSKVPAGAVGEIADPTGVGDAFRAGFLAATSWDLPLETRAQVGCTLASIVLETVGPQEYTLDPSSFTERIAKTYGDEAAAVRLAAPLKQLRLSGPDWACGRGSPSYGGRASWP